MTTVFKTHPVEAQQQLAYTEFLPPKELRDYIRCYWLLDSDGKAVCLQNKLIPFGCIDLIFQQTPVVFYHAVQDEQRILLPQFIISPQSVRAFDIEICGVVKIGGVRLQPYSPRCLLGLPAAGLNNTIWPVRSKLGDAYHKLGLALCQATGNASAEALLNSFFTAQYAGFEPVDAVVKALCEQLADVGSDMPLQHIFDGYKETAQTLRQRFREQVGLSPKFFQKLIRLHHALSLYHYRGRATVHNLTSLALEAGYYDQAHFIRDFHTVFKATPRHFLNAPFPVTKHYLNPQHWAYLPGVPR
jgi:AraC-like DNA-binding protein